jgi:hypothetical protein
MVLHRIVPPEAAGEPLVVTFALSGLGEARLDDVKIRVLERSGQGPAATLVSTPARPAGSPGAAPFPGPADLLEPRRQLPPAAASPPPAAAWPGTNLGWPNLLGGSPNEPPPGPGGGTVDPFKRARGATP